MAKPLVLRFGADDIPLDLSKVDRAELYGFIETEAQDAKGRKCFSATLADDGQTLVGSGGSAFASLAPDGTWLEKSSLKAIDSQGNPMVPVPSSYSAPVPVTDTVTIDEYLSHNIRAVYQISCQGDWSLLSDKLKAGTIFTFPYSYRGGLEPDTAFLLMAADGTAFLAIGTATKLEFVGFDQPASTEEDSVDGDSEEIDFGMM